MSGTGIVRDDLFTEHNPGPWHPESPERLRAIYKALDSGEWPGLVTLERHMASTEDILLNHTESHFNLVARTDGVSHSVLDADTHTSSASFQAAMAAAGGLIYLTQKVIDGELDNGFALIRPPGHHAEPNRAMGFCLFNNVAVAAAWAIKNRGLSKVMIVDWDLHHGNGTQHAFESNPHVLYLSSHQYPFYPGTGALGETGRGKGLGYTINIPLSWGHGDADFVAIYKKIVLPVARKFRPELILVSAGFDIHHGDPLGEMRVSRDGFAAMTRVLKSAAEEVCQGRLVITLEGGYNVDGQARGVASVLDVLTNARPSGESLFLQNPPEPAIIEQVRRIQADFWNF